MPTGLLLATAVTILGFMTLAFSVARYRRRLDTVDAAWGLAFVVAATAAAGYTQQWRSWLIMLLVDIWALRLTTHLLERARTRRDDPRYLELSKKWRRNFWWRTYLSIFLVQGALVWIVSLPIVLAAGTTNRTAPVCAAVGALLWLVGFIVEVIADRQLAAFLANQENKGRTLRSGLWHYSRHPNYFGEITQWFGIGIIACGAHWGWLGLAGPLVLAGTIIFVSGIPPIEKRHRNDPEYQAYKRRTSPLIPWRPLP